MGMEPVTGGMAGDTVPSGHGSDGLPRRAGWLGSPPKLGGSMKYFVRAALFAASAMPALASAQSQDARNFGAREFVQQISLSPDGTQVVDVTGFVYCPRFDKRDYLMQVEGICNSIKWEEE